MRRALFVVLAGCSSSSPAHPDAPSIDATVHDASCAVGPDEDGDQLVDACDPCPISADNTDTDQDGVGDACDPNPSTPGDRIVLFEGFSNGLPPAAEQIGTWTITNGTAHIVAGATAAGLVWLDTPMTRQTITAAGRVEAVTYDTRECAGAGLVDQLDDTSGRGAACILGKPTTVDAPQLMLLGTGASTPNASMALSGIGADETFVLLHQPGAGSSFTCSAGAVTVANTVNISLPAAPSTGLWARNATATFRWIMVVDSPGG